MKHKLITQYELFFTEIEKKGLNQILEQTDKNIKKFKILI